jgi:subtilisin family serine protease
MKSLARFSFLVPVIAVAMTALALAEDAYVEGEVLVTFKPGITTSSADERLGSHSLKFANKYDRLSDMRGRRMGMVREHAKTTAELISSLKADDSVETVEPNYIRHVSVTAPNDTYFSQLWGLQNTGQTVNSTASTSGVDTGFLQAWRLAKSSTTDVCVGVIDTGVDISHPDLQANIWTNPNEIAGNSVDDDGDGYKDDVHGYDFASSTATITDSGYHGTHVAGTIGAVGKNSMGVIGVDYKVKIIPMKVSTDGETMTSAAIVAAYNYSVTLKNKGINIVACNASYGGSSSSTTEQTAIAAMRDAGIILCCAAANGGSDGIGDNNDTTPNYPSSYALSNIISVASIGQTGALSSFSNYGATSVDLAAPGENIYSTKPTTVSSWTSSIKVGSTTYAAQNVAFSGASSGITGTIYNCGLGGSSSDFPSGVSGNIALIQRGTYTFVKKVTNAMTAGAKAVIIYDNTTNALSAGSWTLGDIGSWVPTIQITQASGTAIIAQLSASGTLVNSFIESSGYQFLDGTSMATPHVTGACAFAAMNFPSDTMAQRIARILNHTTAVSSLSGKMTTGGRLNLLGIVDTDGDGMPDWWETTYFGSLSQTATGDYDGDGFTNLEEFYAGTSPASLSSKLAFSSFGPSTSTSSNFVLKFSSVEDSSYQIQTSTDLKTWSTFGSTLTGTGSDITVTDSGTISSTPKKFYRLKVLTQ